MVAAEDYVIPSVWQMVMEASDMIKVEPDEYLT